VKNAKTPILMLALAALLGACSSTPVAPPPAPKPVEAAPQPAPAPPPRPVATAKPMPESTVATVALPEYLDPKSEISTGRSVYFDFDKAVLKSDFDSLVERQGKYLSAHPKLVVRLEGNTDERGSAEYNLALGQKRAESLRQALKIYGVNDSQMEAISWGEEKPKALGHDESAWAQNRRADVQYPSR
jgi:peptidoglycan-associated lipoprotein